MTLRELSAAFGLTHPDSVRNLSRRVDRALLGSRLLRDQIEAIRHRLPKTGPDPAKPCQVHLLVRANSIISLTENCLRTTSCHTSLNRLVGFTQCHLIIADRLDHLLVRRFGEERRYKNRLGVNNW